jgi:hypothetical protein
VGDHEGSGGIEIVPSDTGISAKHITSGFVGGYRRQLSICPQAELAKFRAGTKDTGGVVFATAASLHILSRTLENAGVILNTCRFSPSSSGIILGIQSEL